MEIFYVVFNFYRVETLQTWNESFGMDIVTELYFLSRGNTTVWNGSFGMEPKISYVVVNSIFFWRKLKNAADLELRRLTVKFNNPDFARNLTTLQIEESESLSKFQYLLHQHGPQPYIGRKTKFHRTKTQQTKPKIETYNFQLLQKFKCNSETCVMKSMKTLKLYHKSNLSPWNV